MLDQIELRGEFFDLLIQADKETVRQVALGKCLACEGPLYRSDYRREPRGALVAGAGEEMVIRFSLCCGREGCRKRATPPSLRFLGRRVYLGAVVIVAAMLAQALGAKEARRATGVPTRTTNRWLGWWQNAFISTDVFMAVCARLVGVAVKDVPLAIVLRLGDTIEERVRRLLEWLRPLTTGSGIGSRLTRDVP